MNCNKCFDTGVIAYINTDDGMMWDECTCGAEIKFESKSLFLEYIIQ